jgi:hypothetical protein
MPADPNNLIWIDMEMTGLRPDSDRIIEMALLVTDAQLNILAESPVWVLHQPDEVLDAMDSWNKGTHATTGLIGRVKAASLSEAQEAVRQVEGISRCPSRCTASPSTPPDGAWRRWCSDGPAAHAGRADAGRRRRVTDRYGVGQGASSGAAIRGYRHASHGPAQ